MLKVGNKFPEFNLTAVVGANYESDFRQVSLDTYGKQWKIIFFWPKDFTFVCPTEIVAFDKLRSDFEDRDAVLLTGSTDNEFCKVSWQKAHPDLAKISHNQFADTARDERSLINQLGVFYAPAGAALRATFIVDPQNVIQHITVNNLDVGRNPEETLRVLDALQTGELCPCNRAIGGETL
jgi:peroxiredoxin (alkyl hydroperoxide reductase subunit C)